MLALAGASYAASKIGTDQIKNGAVTERKLHNGNIDPVKWDARYVTAFVRRWANVGSDGQFLSGSKSGASKAQSDPGTYELTWGDAFKSFCAPLVSVQSASGAAGFANANIVTQPNNATVVFVHTYDTHGNPAQEPFSIAILCPKGAGGGQTFPYTLP
jgi:hypothetical protein